MKRLSAIAILSAGISLPAFSLEPDATLGLELGYTALHLIDWQQSRRIAANPAQWVEKNRVLGSNPSQASVNRYMALTLVGHWAVTYALPQEARPYWQGATITLEAIVIKRNAQLGVSVRF